MVHVQLQYPVAITTCLWQALVGPTLCSAHDVCIYDVYIAVGIGQHLYMGGKGGGGRKLSQSKCNKQNKNLRCGNRKQTNKQKFKVRQPQRAAKSKRPNAPSDGSKNNGIHTTKQEEYPSRHPTTDTANSSTSKQITSRRLIGVSKSNTIQSTNQAGCPVSPPHMYHPRRPAHQPRLIPKHVAI